MWHFGLEGNIIQIKSPFMETNRTYISFVIQSEQHHVYDFTIVKLPAPRIAIYSDNTSQEVVTFQTSNKINYYETHFSFMYRNCLLYTSPSPRDRTRSR